jgi:2-oxo-4-hydroxy-4-carboxy-5-ureidoimidazoline decarboxylase
MAEALLEPHAVLNEMSREQARAALFECCGATRWVEGMIERRPFTSTPELMLAADTVWSALEAKDYLEAFTHHPEIGDVSALRERFTRTAELSAGEQAGIAGTPEPTLIALRDGNRAYSRRFGFIFIVCASGKTADEMLDMLQERLQNEPDRELGIAAAEQAKITKLRLRKVAP